MSARCRSRSFPKKPCVLEYDFVEWQKIALELYAEVLHSEGLTESALEVIQQAQDSVAAYLDLGSVYIYCGIIYSKVDFLTHLGYIDKALALAESTLDKVRTQWRSLDYAYLRKMMLVAVAIAADHAQLYERVVEVASEAVLIYESEGEFKSGPAANGWSSFAGLWHRSFQFLSLGNANLGKIDEALRHARRAADIALQLKSVWFPDYHFEQSYMEAHGHLAKILLHTGQLKEATKILEERLTYLHRQIPERSGYYPDLISTQRILSIIYCSQGDHSKGAAISQELRTALDRISTIFPSLHEQIIIRIRYEDAAPISRPINAMKEALDCNHQVALFV